MNQKDNGYYPKDRPFTEISANFLGMIKNPEDVICYLKLNFLNKKLDLNYPEYCINSSYGTFLKYECRTVFKYTTDNTEKKHKVKAICNELIKHGIKNKYIPNIKFIYCENEKNITILTLENYLKSKSINLEDLNIQEIILDEENFR